MKKPTKPKKQSAAAKKADQALDIRVKADTDEMQKYAIAALAGILSNSEMIAGVTTFAQGNGHPEKTTDYLADSAWGYSIAMFNARRKTETALRKLYKNGSPLPGSEEYYERKENSSTIAKPNPDFHGNN